MFKNVKLQLQCFNFQMVLISNSAICNISITTMHNPSGKLVFKQSLTNLLLPQIFSFMQLTHCQKTTPFFLLSNVMCDQLSHPSSINTWCSKTSATLSSIISHDTILQKKHKMYFKLNKYNPSNFIGCHNLFNS